MLVSLWLGSAVFASERNCPREYELVQFRRFLAAVDEEYLNLEFKRAQTLLEAGQPNIPCIETIVPTEDVAQYAIRRSYALALDLDENEAIRWAQLAFTLDPKIEWPSYIPPDHAARNVLEGVEAPVLATNQERGLALPLGGGAFLDGRFLDKPTAESGMPHLLQVGDGAGDIVHAGWQDGTAFPEDFLGPLAPPLAPPRWYGADGKIRRAPRPWTPRRFHRLESAAGFAIVSGTLFATAHLASAAYADRPTNGLFYTVNGTTIASGVAGGTAVVLFGTALFGK